MTFLLFGGSGGTVGSVPCGKRPRVSTKVDLPCRFVPSRSEELMGSHGTIIGCQHRRLLLGPRCYRSGRGSCWDQVGSGQGASQFPGKRQPLILVTSRGSLVALGTFWMQGHWQDISGYLLTVATVPYNLTQRHLQTFFFFWSVRWTVSLLYFLLESPYGPTVVAPKLASASAPFKKSVGSEWLCVGMSTVELWTPILQCRGGIKNCPCP